MVSPVAYSRILFSFPLLWDLTYFYLAAVLLKQFIKKHWDEGDEAFEHPAVSSEEKVFSVVDIVKHFYLYFSWPWKLFYLVYTFQNLWLRVCHVFLILVAYFCISSIQASSFFVFFG